METTTTAATALELRQSASHAPTVGRDVNARLGGARPNQDVDLPPFWGEDGFTFDDLVDLMNPLHHIPLVGSLYRTLTGDQIAAGPRIMGGALFAGGPVGAMAAAAGNAVNAGIAHETGNDVGGHMLAWLGVGDEGGVETPNPTPTGDSVEVAELNGLPWLNRSPIANAAPDAARQAAAVATEPPAVEVMAGATPAAAPPGPRASTTNAGDQNNLSDHQWAMLVASLEPQEVARAEARPTDPPTPAQDPADIAAAMVHALDKYEALTRARSFDDLAE